MSKHTPEPWKIRDEKADWVESGACFDIVACDGRPIGFVTRSTVGIDDDEALANALAFAAAPKLLGACKRAEAFLCKTASNRGFEERLEENDLIRALQDVIGEAERTK
jgi:hypothetical protein